MPANLIWKEDYFIIQYSGVTKLSDTLQIYDVLSGNPKYDAAKFLIIDCRELEDIQYTERDYDVHAAFGKTLESFLSRDNFRGAVVVSSKKIEQGIKKFLQAADKFQHEWNRKIFWDYDEALKWAKSD